MKKIKCRLNGAFGAWVLGGMMVLLSCLPAHAQAIAQKSFVTNVVAVDTGIQINTSTVGNHKLYWRTSGTVTTCQVRLDSSADGVTWNVGDVIAAQTCTSNGSSAVVAANVAFVRINVAVFSGTGTVTVTYAGETDLPGGTTTASNFPATVSTGNGVTDASTLRVTVSSDSTGQIKATNLPTTVDTNSGASGASTLRVVTATNSPVQLSAGTAIAGKVGIDQTTPGTTNAVSATNLPTTVSTNLGSPDASSIRVVTATATPADATSNASVPGVGGLQAFAMTFNGTTWDRIRSGTGFPGSLIVSQASSTGSALADANSNSINLFVNDAGNTISHRSYAFLFNNSTWDRARSGATANLPNLIGSTLVANVTVDPCQSSAVAKSSVAIAISSATTTSLVAASGSTIVYVCGFTTTMVGATESIKFVYGTQATTPCDTGQTALTGAMADGTASDIAWSYGPGSTIFKTIASQQLCAVTTGTVSIQGVLTYVQQ